ncbi:MAG: HNH endonuclease [Armatimonadia bacterium]|nr:HNH endonuclease [Armatimonadia bacterium]
MPNRGRYGNKWHRMRTAYLETHPWCRVCWEMGKRVRATDVDHIVRHDGPGDPMFWKYANWQPLCSMHHKSKSGREAHGLKPKMGSGVDGWPADPDHPWNVGSE